MEQREWMGLMESMDKQDHAVPSDLVAQRAFVVLSDHAVVSASVVLRDSAAGLGSVEQQVFAVLSGMLDKTESMASTVSRVRLGTRVFAELLGFVGLRDFVGRLDSVELRDHAGRRVRVVRSDPVAD